MMYDHDSSEGAIEEEGIAWRRGLHVLAFVLVAGLIFALIASVLGCVRGEAAGAYAAQQQACLTRATHDARIACINAVRAAWAADGGGE